MVYEVAVNMTGLVNMFQYANRVTDNVFVILLLITIYIVPFIYLLLKHHEWMESSMAAGFIVTISAILLRVTEIVTQEKYIFFSLATIIVPLFIKLIEDRSD